MYHHAVISPLALLMKHSDEADCFESRDRALNVAKARAAWSRCQQTRGRTCPDARFEVGLEMNYQVRARF